MNCPNCSSPDFRPHLNVKDHFLSNEDFTLVECVSCGLLKTDPFPSADKLSEYYKSEEYLSHGAEKKGVFASMYRLAKSYNLGKKVSIYRSLHPQGKLLDYGCGTGDLIAQAQASGYEVRGAEPSQEAIEHAPSAIKGLIESPEAELRSERLYDLISLYHVLEHVPDPKELVQSLRRKFLPNGFLIIAVPNFSSFDAEFYESFWAAWDVPRHLWHYSPDQMIPFIEQHGFKHVDSQPMWFDAYYVSLLSERYRSGHPISGLFWATISNLKALFHKKRKCSSQIYIFKTI